MSLYRFWAYESIEERRRRQEEEENRRVAAALPPAPTPTPRPMPTPMPTPRPVPVPTPAPMPTPQATARPMPTMPTPRALEIPPWIASYFAAPETPQPYRRPVLPTPPLQEIPAWARSFMQHANLRGPTQAVEGMTALLSDIVTGRTAPMEFGQRLTREAGGGNALDEIAAMYRMGQERQKQMPITTEEIAEASRRYVAEPLQAALIQQSLPVHAAEALGLRKVERTQAWNPLSTLYPAMGMIVSDGRIAPARAYREQQEYAARQPTAERMLGTFAADPFGLPANIALATVAPSEGVPALLYKAYTFLDTVDFAANVLTADTAQLATMGLANVALKYGPRAVMQAMRARRARAQNWLMPMPSDEELAEAAARAWYEADARDYLSVPSCGSMRMQPLGNLGG